MNEEMVTRILAIERDANQIHADAEQQAAEVVAEARKTAGLIQQRLRGGAQEQAQVIVGQARQAAEAERAQIIAAAEAKAQHLKMLAAGNLERAVAVILDNVLTCD